MEKTHKGNVETPGMLLPWRSRSNQPEYKFDESHSGQESVGYW